MKLAFGLVSSLDPCSCSCWRVSPGKFHAYYVDEIQMIVMVWGLCINHSQLCIFICLMYHTNISPMPACFFLADWTEASQKNCTESDWVKQRAPRIPGSTWTFPLAARRPVASRWNCSRPLFPRRQKTFEHCVLERKALGSLESHCTTKVPSFIAWFLDSCVVSFKTQNWCEFTSCCPLHILIMHLFAVTTRTQPFLVLFYWILMYVSYLLTYFCMIQRVAISHGKSDVLTYLPCSLGTTYDKWWQYSSM